VAAIGPDVVEYRDIPGFPGYRVGNDVSVWSCWKRGPCRGLTGRWRRLRLVRRYDGYLVIGLYRDGTQRQRQVHRLILEAFIGPCPPGMECCHWDGNPANNRPENLRWATPAANRADQSRHGTLSRCGEVNGQAKLREEHVRAILRLLRAGDLPLREIARLFHVHPNTVQRIGAGRIWKHISEVPCSQTPVSAAAA
jgi:hypothetical protein